MLNYIYFSQPRWEKYNGLFILVFLFTWGYCILERFLIQFNVHSVFHSFHKRSRQKKWRPVMFLLYQVPEKQLSARETQASPSLSRMCAALTRWVLGHGSWLPSFALWITEAGLHNQIMEMCIPAFILFKFIKCLVNKEVGAGEWWPHGDLVKSLKGSRGIDQTMTQIKVKIRARVLQRIRICYLQNLNKVFENVYQSVVYS